MDVLIDHENGCWNFVVVQGLFNDEDHRIIEGIHISKNLKDDGLIWKEATDGKFSIHLAYTMAKHVHGFVPIYRVARDAI